MTILAMLILPLFLFFHVQTIASSASFLLDVTQLNDARLQKCALDAIAQINNKSCLSLRILDHQSAQQQRGNANQSTTTIIRFAQSSLHGPCGLDVPPRSADPEAALPPTIFLNPKCVASSPKAVCLQLLGRALTGQKMPTDSVLDHINAHFGCPGNCPELCQHGGLLLADDECSCQCPFNGMFMGETCAELVKLADYSDSACGLVNVSSSNGGGGGILKLSGPLDRNTYCQFLLTTDDPWARFEIDFLEMDMSRKSAGSIDCPDKLQIYGLNSSPMFSVKCTDADAPQPGQSFLSAANFLLIQLEANRFDPTSRQGPIIHYALRPPPYTDEIHSRHSASASQNGGDGAGNSRDSFPEAVDGGFFANGNHHSLIALLVVIGGVSIIVLILVAIRRHSTNKVKRNAAHTPIPSSPTPPPNGGPC